MLHLVCLLTSFAAEPTFEPTREAVVVRGVAEGKVRVYVIPEKEGRPAILGKMTPISSGLRFVPRFGFEPGVRYRVVVDVPGRDSPRTHEFSLAKEKPAEPTRLSAVHPTTDRIPANVLKIYLHFSAPMSQGDSYRHIKLIGPGEKAVELPFLELPEELWDADGKRLTLYIDPGRIKREVKPRLDLGPVFVPGERYTLEVSGRWKDTSGTPLGETFRKSFTAAPPLRGAHDPQKWDLTAPEAGSRSPLKVRSPRSLDHALSRRMIRVLAPDGTPVKGSVSLKEHETVWEFVPTEAWAKGDYRLRVDTALEDISGNRVDAPFEVDVFERVEATVKREFKHVAFTVD